MQGLAGGSANPPQCRRPMPAFVPQPQCIAMPFVRFHRSAAARVLAAGGLLLLLSACAGAPPSGALQQITYATDACSGGDCGGTDVTVRHDGLVVVTERKDGRVEEGGRMQLSPQLFQQLAEALEPVRPGSGNRAIDASDCARYTKGRPRVRVNWTYGSALSPAPFAMGKDGERVQRLSFDSGCTDSAAESVRHRLAEARRILPVK